MALTATYNQPASDWTRGIDRALAEWGQTIAGDANFNVDLSFDASPGLLAGMSPTMVPIGTYRGAPAKITQAAARFQGYESDEPDFQIRVNPNQPWSHGASPQRNAYSWQETAQHELGHGLGVTLGSTPWNVWRDQNPSIPTSLAHFETPGSLMDHTIGMGDNRHLSADELRAFQASGIPTSGDDTFWLIDQARLDGGGGDDKAIWLKAFDDYNAQLSRINRLEMAGDDPLTDPQEGLYKLYSAAFGRDPDLAGYQWWDDSGQDLIQAATGFYGSQEFAPTANIASNDDYIAALYSNILGRAPDAADTNYWRGRTDLDRAGLLANISYAPENQIDTVGFSL